MVAQRKVEDNMTREAEMLETLTSHCVLLGHMEEP